MTIGSPWSPEIDPRRLENHPSGGPKFGQNGFQKVPWRPLGGPWTASGRPLGAKAGFGASWGSIWGSFLAFKIIQHQLQNEPEIEHRFGTTFLASGSRRGSSLGPFWGPFGGHFGVDFRPPGAISDFCKKRARASAGARFSRFRGSKKRAHN